MPTPPHWESNREKPMCRECGCVEFSDDMICVGCGEPLVVRPFKKVPVLRLIAADKWGNHYPKDYNTRCFLCGWKARATLFSIIPKDPADLMAADIWGTLPDARHLAKVICEGRTISDRMSTVFGMLAHTGANAIFKVSANKKYKELASKYKDGEHFSFCRKCAEEEAKEAPSELPPPNAVSLTESMASAMGSVKSKPILPSAPLPKPPTPAMERRDALLPKSRRIGQNDGDWGMDDDNWDQGEDDFLPECPDDEAYESVEESSSDWGDTW